MSLAIYRMQIQAILALAMTDREVVLVEKLKKEKDGKVKKMARALGVKY